MKRKIIFIVAAAVVAAAAVAAFFVGRAYYDHKVANVGGCSEIYVYPEMTGSDVLASVCENAEIRHAGSLRRAFAEENMLDAPCRPGHYTIDSTCTSIYVARMLKHGWQTPVKLVISGAIRSRQSLARKISSQMLLDSASIVKSLSDNEFLAAYGVDTAKLFAIIIPDTYEVLWTDPLQKIMDRQKKAYDAFWTPENIAKARRQDLDSMEVAILASIVKGESNYIPEYPNIASVYLNRLHIGMKLQADPTIAFCFNYEPRRILKAHLKVESPYNTYKYKGLPPAPICVPGKEAMNAVLNPAETKYLYFCASPDFNGTHRFATNFKTHKENARAFQKALSAR